MDLLAFPDHALDPYPTGGPPPDRLLEIVGSLLYFNSVTVIRPGSPEELGLPDANSALEEQRRIQARRGTDVVKWYWHSGEAGPLTLREIATLDFVKYAYRDIKFRQTYAPLLEAGIVRIVSLAEVTAEARKLAEFAGVVVDESLSLTGALAGFHGVLSRIHEWRPRGDTAQVWFDAAGDSDGLGLAGWFLKEIYEAGDGPYLEATDSTSRVNFICDRFALDLYFQTLLSALLSLPLLAYNRNHLECRATFVSQILRDRETRPAPVLPGEQAVAAPILAEALRQLPLVFPRSPESLLRLREDLRDELAELRIAVERIARDLLQDRSEETPVDNRQITAEVDATLRRPVEDLRRKLNNPGRDLLANLVSTPAMASGAISMLAGSCFAGTTASALLAVAGTVPAMLFKTYLDRQKARNEAPPGLAFLLKASQSAP